MSDMGPRRLRHEYMALSKTPVEHIRAAPLETNILEWHYVITGTKGTPYEGGHYHGILRFPPEYPLKPPAVLMNTPNGRFATGRRLCLSNSDFHPESWNPVWGVSTILMGLYSFMLDSAPTLGSVVTNTSTKKKYALESLAFNCKNKHFVALFPDLVELHAERLLEERRKAAAAPPKAAGGGKGSAVNGSGEGNGTSHRQNDGIKGSVCIFIVCVAICLWAGALMIS